MRISKNYPGVRRNSARRLQLQVLERRQLLAASVVLVDGELMVHGDDEPNQISISASASTERLIVEIDGRTVSYPSQDVKHISVFGHRGDDRIGVRDNVRQAARLDGGVGDDQLNGGSQGSRLIGGEGNDAISGGRGNDFIDGGDGNDRLGGEGGDDVIVGGNGNDGIGGGRGDDSLMGGAGNDTVYGGDGDDVILGDHRMPRESMDPEAEEAIPARSVLLAQSLDMQFVATSSDGLASQDDELHGGAGDDVMFGMRGDDQMSGDQGHDILFGGVGNDRMEGNEGHDNLYGGAGNDRISGDAGNDLIRGGDGDDLILGGLGDDALAGGDGSDRIFGGRGDDRLWGGEGRDYLEGGEGNDWVHSRDGMFDVILTDGLDRLFTDPDDQVIIP